MKIAKVYINETNAHTISCKDIPRGIVGGQVELEYAKGVWDGLIRNVVFTNGRQIVAAVNAGALVTIPAEVTDTQNAMIRMGVCGVSAQGETVIPTLWTDLRRVSDAVPVDAMPGTDPALPVWGQMLQKIGDLEALSTQEKVSLVAAVNEVHGARLTSVQLKEDDRLDNLVENGRYYLCNSQSGEIEQLLADAGVDAPDEINGQSVRPVALFLDVTRVERVVDKVTDGLGHPCQRLTVYFKERERHEYLEREYHRVQGFDGKTPNSRSWNGWITATKNGLLRGQELFTVKFDVTTFPEIIGAVNAGMLCVLDEGNGAFTPMTRLWDDRYEAVFSRFEGGVEWKGIVDMSGWRESIVSYRKADEITDKTSGDSLPTVQAVRDLLQSLEVGGTGLDEAGALEDLAEAGIIEPLANEDNGIFVDENDHIFTL